MQLNNLLSMVLWFVFASQLYAMPIYQEEQAKAAAFVELLYHNELDNLVLPMSDRLEKISRLFLGKAYYWGPLGEGASGQYDQYPLFRVDQFDCLTFVETVLALSMAHDLNSFQQQIRLIRYQDGEVSFLKRNHFTDLDWNKNNQVQGYLKDITLSIKNDAQQPVAQLARAMIDKPSWYHHIPMARIRLADHSNKIRAQQWQRLKAEGQHMPVSEAIVPYIPLSALIDKSSNPNETILKQIPNGAIIEIVRPGWDLRSVIGTKLNISHLGFAFWRDNTLYFRNASTLNGIVVDQPLIPYLRDALSSPTIKGINVQIVLKP